VNEVISPEILAALQRRSGLADANIRPLFGLPLSVPLVLDVDGTLIDGDLLHKSFFWNVLRNPLIVLSCALWLSRGRAVLKRQLALRCRIDWDGIRLHRNVVALAVRENAAGRKVVLATAADAILAGQLASRLGFVDQVLASDGCHNYKGTAKADLLRQSFPAGFIYAGDSKSDLGVWRHASGIIVVNARRSVADAARKLKQPILEMRDRLYVSLPQ
jgi:phosphoserine phosphatase